MRISTTVTTSSSIDGAEVADEAHGDEADGELEDGGEDGQERDVMCLIGGIYRPSPIANCHLIQLLHLSPACILYITARH
jgi:hypothetical protein